MNSNGKPRLDLSPSSADRWTSCTASPRFIFENWDKVPPSDTDFSKEGTTAHEVAASLLQNRAPDLRECPSPITPEIRKHAWAYMEYVESLLFKHSTMLVEQKIPLWYMPERNAKVDVLIDNQGSYDSVDLKYGEGVAVSPVRSLQCSTYIRTAVEKFKPAWLRKDSPIRIHIYQPRGRNAEDGAAHVWETTWGEIYDFTEEHISKPAKLILSKSPDLKFAPSDKACQWCAFKNPTPKGFFCGARKAAMVEQIAPLAALERAPGHLAPVQSISVKQLCAILEHGGKIKQWIDEAQKFALQFMKDGGTIPGFKVVTSRGGNRYWTQPELAAKHLLQTHLRRDEVFEEKLISVKQAEDLLGKNKFSAQLTSLIAKPAGQPTIAPESDSRESCLTNGAKEFENLAAPADKFF